MTGVRRIRNMSRKQVEKVDPKVVAKELSRFLTKKEKGELARWLDSMEGK